MSESTQSELHYGYNDVRKLNELYRAMAPYVKTQTHKVWVLRIGCRQCLGRLEITDTNELPLPDDANEDASLLAHENEDLKTKCLGCGERWNVRIRRSFDGSVWTEVFTTTKIEDPENVA